MSAEVGGRHELATFLRRRRAEVLRSDLGLGPLKGGALRGLRREEVAVMSDVSVTWYTWLEQARPINPSAQVVTAIARTLRLDDTETSFVLELAGLPVPRQDTEAWECPASVQRLLDAMGRYPAYAIAPDWSIIGWNDAYAAFYPAVLALDPARRNLLWTTFTDAYVQQMLLDWDDYSHRIVAEFRAEAGRLLDSPAFRRLVGELLAVSETFRAVWAEHDVRPFTTRERVFRHPVVGDLTLEHHQLAPDEAPDLHVVIYRPVEGTGTDDRLGRLTST